MEHAVTTEKGALARIQSSLLQIVTFHTGLFGRHSQFGMGTAALIDKKRRILAVNAHSVVQGNRSRVWFPTIRRHGDISLDRRLIYWDANIAFLQIPEKYADLLDAEYNELVFMEPSPAEEKEMENYSGNLRLVGLFAHPGEDPLFRPFQRACDVQRYRTHFGITFPMLQEEWRLEQSRRISNEDKAKLFKRYILLYCGEGILPEMSSFLLATADGKPLGILDRGDEHTALAIPSSAINEGYRMFFPA